MRSIITSLFYSFLLLGSLGLMTGCNADDLGATAESRNDSNSSSGIAGSYARFLTVGDFLYVVDEASIQTFSLDNPEKPSRINQQTIGESIETIYHLDGQLFIGSGSGLYIYSISSNGVPTFVSQFPYESPTDEWCFPVNPWDPVVANSEYAYVTLRDQAESPCGGFVEVNVLNIFDISEIENPELLAQYPMVNPRGVGLDGTTLFVCDDIDGLKVYNVEDPFNIQLIEHVSNITTYDVIPLDGLLLVVGPDNVYQFDYSDLDNIVMISQIPYGA